MDGIEFEMDCMESASGCAAVGAGGLGLPGAQRLAAGSADLPLLACPVRGQHLVARKVPGGGHHRGAGVWPVTDASQETGHQRAHQQTQNAVPPAVAD